MIFLCRLYLLYFAAVHFSVMLIFVAELIFFVMLSCQFLWFLEYSVKVHLICQCISFNFQWHFHLTSSKILLNSLVLKAINAVPFIVMFRVLLLDWTNLLFLFSLTACWDYWSLQYRDLQVEARSGVGCEIYANVFKICLAKLKIHCETLPVIQPCWPYRSYSVNKSAQTTNLLYSTLNPFIVYFLVFCKRFATYPTEEVQCKREES